MGDPCLGRGGVGPCDHPCGFASPMHGLPCAAEHGGSAGHSQHAGPRKREQHYLGLPISAECSGTRGKLAFRVRGRGQEAQREGWSELDSLLTPRLLPVSQRVLGARRGYRMEPTPTTCGYSRRTPPTGGGPCGHGFTSPVSPSLCPQGSSWQPRVYLSGTSRCPGPEERVSRTDAPEHRTED